MVQARFLNGSTGFPPDGRRHKSHREQIMRSCPVSHAKMKKSKWFPHTQHIHVGLLLCPIQPWSHQASHYVPAWRHYSFRRLSLCRLISRVLGTGSLHELLRIFCGIFCQLIQNSPSDVHFAAISQAQQIQQTVCHLFSNVHTIILDPTMQSHRRTGIMPPLKYLGQLTHFTLRSHTIRVKTIENRKGKEITQRETGSGEKEREREGTMEKSGENAVT